MKKGKMLILAAITAGVLSGCGEFSPEETTVCIDKDGNLQTAVVDVLDKDYYSSDELKSSIDQAVAAYNSQTGEEKVELVEFEAEDQQVKLLMNYASAEDYQAFNNVVFYSKDLQGAYDSGYAFPERYQSVEKGKVTGEVTRSDILSGLNYNVVLFTEDMTVEVPGNILYISDDLELTGKKTARTANAGSVLEEQGSEAETSAQTESEAENTLAPTEESEENEGEHTPSYIIYE